jgi:nucleotide-binding universal stress UspA family protein
MNLQIRKILVPIDFSETGLMAMQHAAFMASLSKAEIILLHVLPLTEYYFEIPEPIMHIDNREQMQRVIEQKLKEIADEVRTRYGIAPRTLSSRGRVASEIVQVAREENVDLIIMGTHGAKGFEEIFLGSNAYKVVNIAPCPVITVQTHASKLGFTNIVLPVDRSAHSREKVEPAIRLASLYAAKIHIVGLLDNDDEGEYDKLQIVLDQVEQAVEKAGVNHTRHTLKGDRLAAGALKYGASVNADLIIIMTEQESEITGIFLGALARQIVNHSRIPVMSIKPHYGEFSSLDLTGAYNFY